MIRILVRLCALLSLTLLVASLSLWIRSHYAGDACGRSAFDSKTQEFSHCSLASIAGQAQWSVERLRFDAGKIGNAKEYGSEGAIEIPPSGILRYSTQWVSENGRAQVNAKHWWEASGLYVRWQSNVRNGTFPATQASLLVIVPYWMLCTIFSISSVIFAIRFWKTKRYPAGSCGNCGYDLRESPKRCPECGAENPAVGTLKLVGASKVAS